MIDKLRCRAVLVVVFGLAAAMVVVRAEIIEQILVKVNGEIFTQTDLEAHQVAILRQRGQQVDLKSDPDNEQLREVLNEITPQIMVDSVHEMLMVQRGQELGYRLSDEQFRNSVDQIKKDNKIESDEQFQAALEQENMTMADLRRQLERQMLGMRVQQNEVMSRVGVSDEEVRTYYDTHGGEFTTTPAVRLREVLVAVPTDGRVLNVSLDDEKKERANQIRARAVGGESFEKLASDLSDAPSRSNAGLIGPISLNDLSPDLRKLVEPMKVGDVSPLIRTQRGYQLFRLESLTPAQTMPFELAREQISERVFTEKRKAELGRYFEKLRSQAIIEWKNEDVKKAFETSLAQEVKPPSE